MKKITDKLENEYNELNDKIRKIEYFINNNPDFRNLSESHQVLLVTQSKVMDTYSYILEERIEELNSHLSVE